MLLMSSRVCSRVWQKGHGRSQARRACSSESQGRCCIVTEPYLCNAFNAPPYSRKSGFAGSAVARYLRLASVSAQALPSQWRSVGAPASSTYTQSAVTMFSRVASKSSTSVGGVCGLRARVRIQLRLRPGVTDSGLAYDSGQVHRSQRSRPVCRVTSRSSTSVGGVCGRSQGPA